MSYEADPVATRDRPCRGPHGRPERHGRSSPLRRHGPYRSALSIIAAIGLFAAACTGQSSEDGTEDRGVPELEAELVEVRGDLEATEQNLADAQNQMEELQAALDDEGAEARATERRLERELRAAREEVEGLRLRYDDEVRADLQGAYDAEIARACEEAADAPARPVAEFVEFDDEWEHLGLSEDDLIEAVSECAGPRRQEAQLNQQQAADRLVPVAEMVLDVIRTGESAEDLPSRIKEMASAVVAGAVFEDPEDAWVEALNRISDGDSCTPTWCTYISILDDLQAIGVPGTPLHMMGGGSRTVGDGQGEARPGTWTAYQVEGCYWERLDERGEIIDNNFVNSAPQVQATIQSSDYAFNSQGCGRWMQF